GTRSTRGPATGSAPVDPKRSAPRVSSRGPSAPPPVLTTPGAREGDVPEPPAEVLEQFAASIRVDPELEPAPPEPPGLGSQAGTAMPAAPMAEEIPEGMLLARPSTRRATGVTAHTRRGAGSRRGGRWPDMGELEERPRSLWPKVMGIALVVAALFGIGWLVGH